MVLLLEIPDFLYPIIFTAIASLVIYSIDSPQVNYVSAPISNFTNIHKTIQYTVTKPDNITLIIYKYGLEGTSKKYNLTINDIIRQLRQSQTFFLNCTLIHEKRFGDPLVTSQDCTIFGRHYGFNP